MGELIDLMKTTVMHWQEDKASRLAAALSFYAVLSIPPLLVLTIIIAGQVVGEASAREGLVTQIEQVMGNGTSEAIKMILESASQPQGLSLATAVSIAVLFFSASGVFVQLQDALNTIWEVKPDPEQGLMTTLRRRAISFLMILGIGILLLALLLMNSLIAFLDQILTELLPFSITWARLLNYGISFGIVSGLIALVYKEIPDVKMAWRDVWLGAVVTAILFALGVFGISLYLRFSSPTSSYGAAGSLIVLLIWIYYSAQIVFLGAEFTQVFANRYGQRIRPDKNAIYMARAHRHLENRT